MSADTDARSWSQIVEDDLYEEDKARFIQWLTEHPDPIQSLKAEVESLHRKIADLADHYESAASGTFFNRVDVARSIRGLSTSAEGKS